MPEMMKAAVYSKYGDPSVLEIADIPIPDITDDQILIRSYASSLNTPDIFYRKGIMVFFGLSRLMTGVFRPKRHVLGFDISGEVVAVGDTVELFKAGDQVFGSCITGANAEYSVSRERALALKPESLSFEEAAAVPMSAISALQGLRDAGGIKQEQRILIYGASGGLGTYAVQLAKHHFGCHVTGVASGKNKDMVLELGADEFIDYKTTDLAGFKQKYDLIFDTVDKFPKGMWKELLMDEGIFVNAGSPSMSMLGMVLRKLGNSFRTKTYATFDASYNREDLDLLAQLLSQEKLRPVIDQVYLLDQIVQAHQHYESRRTVGKVVVSIQD